MKQYFFFSFLLLVGCKTGFEQKKFVYQNEESLITTYNSTKKDLPLLVVLPETQKSVFTQDVLKRLAKRYRIVSVSFLSPEDISRQKQLDNLTNRINFYSEYLNMLAVTTQDSMVIMAEGLNANFISHYIHAFPIKEQVFVNPYKPSLNELFTNVCYANPAANCDSVLNHFGLLNRTVLDSLVVAIDQQGTDNQYGNYSLAFWKDALDYPLQPNLTSKKRYLVFTSNTGLQGSGPTAKDIIITPKAELKDVLVAITRN